MLTPFAESLRHLRLESCGTNCGSRFPIDILPAQNAGFEDHAIVDILV